MNDIEYRYFYEVARTLNFNQAAENLYISQPALSRCISKIEEEFDVQLFIRTKRSVQLTDAGTTLLNNYASIQKATLELHEKVQNAARGMHGKILIGIMEGHLITPAIKALIDTFVAQNEDISIEVVSIPYSSLFKQLNANAIDIALSLDFPSNVYPDIQCQPLEERSSYVFLSKNHPAALAGSLEDSFAMLNQADLLIVKWSIVPNVTNHILNQCNANGFMPANIHYASSYLTLYNWLIMGKGFAIMDKGSIFNENLITSLPLREKNQINFCAYWNKAATNNAVARFISHIRKGDLYE